MLFDHGCDSFTIGIMVTITAKCIGINNPMLLFLYIFECVGLFYFGTLEEYYVGGLHLPVGNGITDGSLPLLSFYMVWYFIGNEFMQVEVLAGNEYSKAAYVVVYCCFAFSLSALAQNFYAIFTKPADSQLGEKVVLKNILVQTFSYLLIIALLQSLAFIGDEPIINNYKLKDRNNSIFYIFMLQNFIMQHLAVQM